MKRLALIGIVVCCAASLLAATNELVVVKLTDGTQIEGLMLAERPEEVIIQLSLAAGTIVKTETFARTNVVAITPLTPAELAARAETTAYEAARRYTLNPASSYPAEYYADVIVDVFREFIARYPNSPQANEVADWLGQWQAEQRLVESGQVKYRGRWLPAAEAGARMESAEGGKLLAQARALAQRGQYERAIGAVRLMPGAETKQFLGETYRRWMVVLEAEQQALSGQLEKARQQLAAADSEKERLTKQSLELPSLEQGGAKFYGPSQEQVVALNQANAAAQMAAKQVEQLQVRLNFVERSLGRAKAGAREFGVTPAEPVASASTGNDKVQDLQAGRIDRGESKNPELLGQMANFFREYWMPLAVIVLGAIWYFSRKMNR